MALFYSSFTKILFHSQKVPLPADSWLKPPKMRLKAEADGRSCTRDYLMGLTVNSEAEGGMGFMVELEKNTLEKVIQT